MARLPVESMSAQELLQELVLEKRRSEKTRWIKTIIISLLAIVVIGGLGTMIYRMYQIMNQYQQTLQEISQNFDQFQTLFDQDSQTISNLQDLIEQIQGFTNGFSSFFGN